MKALSIHQPYATLIIMGVKPYEWRTWEPPKYIIDQPIVIHASKNVTHWHDRIREILDDIHGPNRAEYALEHPRMNDAVDLLQECMVRTGSTQPLPTGAGLGTAIVGGFYRPLPISNIGWAMLDVQKWWQPESKKGMQGLFNWS